MSWTIAFILILFAIYAFSIFLITIEWLKTRILNTNPELDGISFSIIIPFRNEEKNIEQCIKSIVDQQYDPGKFEIICVDDQSSDRSAEIISTFAAKYKMIRLIDSNGNGKKAALQTGIEVSRFNHIITTDADTDRGKHWLSAYSTMFRYRGIKVVIGTLLMVGKGNSLLGAMQSLDYMGMMAFSMVASRKKWFYNGSGGNLAFTKDVYFDYLESAHDQDIVSGDDVFLIEFVSSKFDKSVLFPRNQEIIAYTQPEPDFVSFLNQRKRWANKSFSYRNNNILAFWAFLWVVNVSFILALIFAIINGGLFIKVFAAALFGKLIVDYFMLMPMGKFFRRPINKFILADFYHILYVVLIGFLAFFNKSFVWKERKFSR